MSNFLGFPFHIPRGLEIKAYDPKGMERAREVLGEGVIYESSAVLSARDADVVAVLTEWSEFGDVPLEALGMRRKRIVDLRNVIDVEAAARAGYEYSGIGR